MIRHYRYVRWNETVAVKDLSRHIIVNLSIYFLKIRGFRSRILFFYDLILDVNFRRNYQINWSSSASTWCRSWWVFVFFTCFSCLLLNASIWYMERSYLDIWIFKPRIFCSAFSRSLSDTCCCCCSVSLSLIALTWAWNKVFKLFIQMFKKKFCHSSTQVIRVSFFK